MSHHNPPVRRTRRPAFGLVLVIAVLAIASLLMASWAKSRVAALRAQRSAHLRLQAAWLADSAVRRAAAQRATDPSYQGETWSVPAGVLPRDLSAEVAIAVTAGDEAGTLTITATADLPPGPDRRARVTKTLDLPSSAD
ncbi:MAG: hypothetical protein AAGJ46_00910 [Planctomycetota bacterium]